MSRRKQALPFDKRGGAIVTQRRLLESAAYLKLSLPARCLMPLMQCHWRNDKPVAYSTREAAERLSCDRRVAMKAMNELETTGFIRLADYSMFNSRTGSKARTWILTWLPYMDRPPTNDWEKKSTGALDAPQN